MAGSTPHYDVTVDATSEDTLQVGCLKVLRLVRPTWDKDQIRLKVFTDGLTNKLMGGWREGWKKEVVLVRVYGEDTEKYIDRGAEVDNMLLLEQGGDGAQLFATFTNGLAYEFVSGDVLQPGIQPPQVYQEVAATMARMHRIDLPPARKLPGVWTFLRRLASLYPTEAMEGLLTLHQLEQEIVSLESCLCSSLSPVVFAHNDAMPANMVRTSQGNVRLIDLEYSGPNYAAFDIANTLNEWVGADVDNLDFEGNYPEEASVEDWISHYLLELHQKGPTQEEVREVREEVRRFTPVNHLVWSTWAVLQALSSSISYDYLGYARQRLTEYRRLSKIQ